MDLPKELRYSEDHHWVRVEGKYATIGVTDFAQEELGMIVFVELPEPGETLKAGEPFGNMESVKTVSELVMPVSGKVLETNPMLSTAPAELNLSPYYKGWLVKVELTDPSELDKLWDADKYGETYVIEEQE